MAKKKALKSFQLWLPVGLFCNGFVDERCQQQPLRMKNQSAFSYFNGCPSKFIFLTLVKKGFEWPVLKWKDATT